MKKAKSDYLIQSVSRALDILEAFTFREASLGVTELSKMLKLHKNNVFRLLATLQTRGYVEQDTETGAYRLGIRTFEVGHVFLHHLDVRGQVRPRLRTLVQKCNETAYLGVLDRTWTVFLDMVETTHPVRTVSRVGLRHPAYCTAMGKALLAAQEPQGIEELLRQIDLLPHTEKTITDKARLREELDQVATQGVAFEDEEFELGVWGVAAPVRAHTGAGVAAIAVVGPSVRLSREGLLDRIAPLVQEAAANASRALGYGSGSK